MCYEVRFISLLKRKAVSLASVSGIFCMFAENYIRIDI
nr:MAG TPA: hypothetical protein [Caudoviricetes sp.]